MVRANLFAGAHRLITERSPVRVQFSPPDKRIEIRGFSSAGRAPALQAGGQGFDSLNLHQISPKSFKCLEGAIVH